MLVLRFLLAALLLPWGALSQTSAPGSALPKPLIARLPADLRDVARRLLTFTPEALERLSGVSDENLRYQVFGSLAQKPEAAPLMVAQLDTEPSSKVRVRLVSALHSYWISHPEAQALLKRRAAADRDPAVALACLEVLRRIRADELASLLAERLAMAERSADEATVRRLAPEQERWISLKRATMLPGFLRAVPPIFTVKPAGESIRVLAFGDYGTGSPGQRQLSQVMLQVHKATPYDFGITLGDNFYGAGMESPSDPRWQTQWEHLYGPLGIKFYATLGNHDWGQPDSPAAEILYSARSGSWLMPSPYYTFLAGPVQFFALDTNEISTEQLRWLRQAISASQAKWKVVYGHHTLYSATRGDNPVMIAALQPIFSGRADIYLCGHDHNLQHLRPEGGTQFFVAGGGGAGIYKTKPSERTIFTEDNYGFAVIEASDARLQVRLFDITGAEVHQSTLTK